MGSISGTYDVLTVAFPLSNADVLELLPKSVQQARPEDSLLSIPDSAFEAIDMGTEASGDKAGQHIVVLQMGYQISTGPGPNWLPKFSFSECKVEIPFMRHPSGKSDTPMVYKQTILFSNPIIKMGSSASGINSKTASFTPSSTPSGFEKDSAMIGYRVDGFLDAKAALLTENLSNEKRDASWQLYRDIVQGWWFASGTGNKVQKFSFDFDHAAITPRPYDVHLTIDLDAFSPHAAADTRTPRHVNVKSLGWRSRTRLTSLASSVERV